MKKLSYLFILLAALGPAIIVVKSIHAEAQTFNLDGNQVLNDEGYGNEDAEYYNSEDDVANVDDPSLEENASAGNEVD